MKRRLGFYATALILATVTILVLLTLFGCGGKPAPTPKFTPVESKKITHELKGFEDCISCHATGLGGAKAYSEAYSAEHSTYTNKDCTLCHKPK